MIGKTNSMNLIQSGGVYSQTVTFTKNGEKTETISHNLGAVPSGLLLIPKSVKPDNGDIWITWYSKTPYMTFESDIYYGAILSMYYDNINLTQNTYSKYVKSLTDTSITLYTKTSYGEYELLLWK